MGVFCNLQLQVMDCTSSLHLFKVNQVQAIYFALSGHFAMVSISDWLLVYMYTAKYCDDFAMPSKGKWLHYVRSMKNEKIIGVLFK